MSSTTPYRSVPPRQRRRGGVVGPLILIFLGGVFLLQNAGYLPPNFWMGLWRFWPLILVLVGIELLFAHRLSWLILVGLGVVVLVLGGVAAGASMPTPLAGPSITNVVQTGLSGSTQATVTLRFGAGQLNIGPLQSPRPDDLATMTYEGPPQLAVEPRYTVTNGGIGRLEYQTTGRPSSGPGWWPFASSRPGGASVDIGLSPNVPIPSLTVETGAADAHLDLSSLRVSTVDLSVGAATAWVQFPASVAQTRANIRGGASTITIVVPPGVAAQIQHRGGLSTLHVDQNRFPPVGDGTYRSPDYLSAANKLELNIETGITTIQVS
ncbi:MAG TPA: DUF5668 domain-containing protein [Chloroflexota bacterium]